MSVGSKDITITYTGEDGTGKASTTTKIDHVTITLTPTTSTLSNNDKVTANLVAEHGYTVNGKATDSIEFTVTGLTPKAVVTNP